MDSFSKTVKNYYDKNTAVFLKVGRSKEKTNIHRQVWANGVKTEEEAMLFLNEIILLEISASNKKTKILDAGCGVGSTLLYLDQNLTSQAELTGITLSTDQAKIGNEQLSRANKINPITLLEGDYHHLERFSNFDFVYMIESFIHSGNPEAVFEQMRQTLVAGGKLMICDDFRGSVDALSSKEKNMMNHFKKGWHAGNLLSIDEMEKLGQRHGFELIKKKEYTSDLKLGRFRDQFIRLMMRIYKWLPIRSVYMESLRGGDALQWLLKRRMVEFWSLTFRLKP